MTSARFGPLPDRLTARCAPTELDKHACTHLKGVAHGFFARLLGEASGIAGAVTMPSSQSATRAGVFEQS